MTTETDAAYVKATEIVNEHFARMGQAIADLPGLKAPTKSDLVRGYLRTQLNEMTRLRDQIAEAMRGGPHR